ncbi:MULTISPECIES: hypothetical protein [unclassified Saccharothrix]|uniref:hypothetical protein n=1 Tax=unclassified Saccharothrix TaxID=2593673 RepID=UPI00307E6423
MARWVWPTAAGVVTSATGVVINLATDLVDNALAWVAVGALTALGVGIGVAAQRADQRHREIAHRAAAIVPPPAADPPATQPSGAQPSGAQPSAVQPTPHAEPEPEQAPQRPAPPRTVYNHSSGNTVGPVIQVGYLHGDFNQGDSVNQSATAHDGGTVYQAGRDVRLDRDR